MTRVQSLIAALVTVGLLAACGAGETADQEAPAVGEDAAVDDDESTDDGDDSADDPGEDDAEGDGPGEDDSEAGDAGDDDASVSIGFAAEPANFDFTNTDGAAIPEALLVNVYEGLVKLDQDGEIQPLLAESYEVSDDGTVYDFHLQADATFSNGDPFDAEAVAFSIEQVQEAWTIGLASGMDVVDDVEVVDEHHARVTLSEPSNQWLHNMTQRIGAMFSPDGVDNLENEAIGTGPYEIADWVRGDRIEFERRDDYWGEDPDFANVTFRYFNDANALNNALLSGDIHVVGTVQAPEALEQFDEDEFTVIEGTSNGTVLLSFNNRSEELSDERVRQAIRHAVDNQSVMDTAWGGYGMLIGSMVPPHDPWYEDLTDLYPYDPDRAVELLEEADATDLELDFRVPNLPYAVDAAQTVQSQLEQVGISTEIDTLEFPARWLEEVFDGHDFDLSIINHVEPRDLVSFGDPDFYWGYDNAEVRELFEEADRAPDPETYEELMADAARIISEDAASEFLFLAPNLIIVDAGVEGLPENRVGEPFDLTVLRQP